MPPYARAASVLNARTQAAVHRIAPSARIHPSGRPRLVARNPTSARQPRAHRDGKDRRQRLARTPPPPGPRSREPANQPAGTSVAAGPAETALLLASCSRSGGSRRERRPRSPCVKTISAKGRGDGRFRSRGWCGGRGCYPAPRGKEGGVLIVCSRVPSRPWACQ
ncbi:unnamed protein product [Lampetra planeri]